MSQTLPRPRTLLFDRFEVEAEIGRGGTGVVLRARDRRLGRLVAVKVVEGVPDATTRREASVLASLSHPALVVLHDAVVQHDAVYLVMEHLASGTLADRIAAGALSTADASRLLADLAGGLAHIHARGIVHLDIKPSNVLMASEPSAKLSDFGIADLAGRRPDGGPRRGTPQYLSPEQLAGGRIGAPSDVYSLGLTVLEALTGARAFPGPPSESAAARLRHDPEVPALLGPGWAALLGAMLHRDPARRPSAVRVAAAARLLGGARDAAGPVAVAAAPTATVEIGLPPTRLLAAPTVALEAAPAPRAPRRRSALAAAAVVLGLLGGGTAVLVTAQAPASGAVHHAAVPRATAPAPTPVRTVVMTVPPTAPAQSTARATATAAAKPAVSGSSTAGTAHTAPAPSTGRAAVQALLRQIRTHLKPPSHGWQHQRH